MEDEEMQLLARLAAETMIDPDKKQLRFNEIVVAARRFYPNAIAAGVIELVMSCDKNDPLYVSKHPMWQTLSHQYGWLAP